MIVVINNKSKKKKEKDNDNIQKKIKLSKVIVGDENHIIDIVVVDDNRY